MSGYSFAKGSLEIAGETDKTAALYEAMKAAGDESIGSVITDLLALAISDGRLRLRANEGDHAALVRGEINPARAKVESWSADENPDLGWTCFVMTEDGKQVIVAIDPA